MRHPIPAQLDAPETLNFCLQVVPDAHAVLINNEPFPGAEVMDCFPNVEMVIEKNGGKAVYGWAIWWVPGVYIEAEFHCIWENDAGEMLDITPYPYHTDNILFLPDSKRIYKGQQVDNIRQALVNAPDVIRWLYLARKRFEILNTGDLANQHGRIELPPKLAKEYIKVMDETERLDSRLKRRYS